MIKWFILMVALSVMSLASARETIVIPVSSVIEVHDGDTLKVNLPCSVDTMCKGVLVRVSHIDTPEIHSKDAHEKALAQRAKDVAMNFVNKSHGNMTMVCGRDKYFRLNCSIESDQGDLATAELNAKLAKPYEGGTKNTDWSNY